MRGTSVKSALHRVLDRSAEHGNRPHRPGGAWHGIGHHTDHLNYPEVVFVSGSLGSSGRPKDEATIPPPVFRTMRCAASSGSAGTWRARPIRQLPG